MNLKKRGKIMKKLLMVIVMISITKGSFAMQSEISDDQNQKESETAMISLTAAPAPEIAKVVVDVAKDQVSKESEEQEFSCVCKQIPAPAKEVITPFEEKEGAPVSEKQKESSTAQETPTLSLEEIE